MKKNKKQMSFKDTLKRIVNSRHPLLIGLIILVLILVWFTHHLISSNQTYTFSGRGRYISILNGAISLNHDTHIFVGSHITYIYEDDILLTEFTIGYHLRRGLEFIPMITISDENEVGISLRALLQHNSVFNVVEPAREGMFNRQESLARLRRAEGLYFIIEGRCIDGNQIEDIIKIHLIQVSK